MKINRLAEAYWLPGLIFCLLALAGQWAVAGSVAEPAHKLVIQVSTDDRKTQAIALNNAVNLQKMYGLDNIAIEIVAYGPGLSLLTVDSSQAPRVASLSFQDVTFSACGNTMEKIKKDTGKLPVLIEGVGIVPAGVSRILELQELGYAYIRP